MTAGELENCIEFDERPFLFLRIFDLVDEVVEAFGVPAAVEEQAVGGLTVPSGPSGFLIVAFDVLGQVGMDDEAHIGFVDAHPEGDGGDDHLAAPGDEGVLIASANIGLQTGVIGQGIDPAFQQIGGGLFDGAAGEAVDDSTVTGRSMPNEVEHLLVDLPLGGDIVIEIGAVEGGQHQMRIPEPEAGADLFLGARGRRGGEGGDGHIRECLAQRRQLEVVGTEVVSPGRDAVRLVDGEEGNGGAPQRMGEGLGLKALRRDVEQVELAHLQLHEPLRLLVGRQGAVEEGGADAQGLELVDLVFHQRDQGADDDPGTGATKGRQLIAERLAAAGGHDGGHIAPRQQGRDNVALVCPEVAVAKASAQM